MTLSKLGLLLGGLLTLATAAGCASNTASSSQAEPVKETPPANPKPGAAPEVASLQPRGTIAVSGKIPGGSDLSGIAFSGDLLYVVSDETAHIEVLKKSGDSYKKSGSVAVGQPDTEVDLEALAIDGEYVYAIGSHSAARPKQKAKDSYADNRAKMAIIQPAGPRDVLARFKPTADGTGTLETMNLRAMLESDPVLKPFAALPGKENGIDIEGLAVKGKEIYVGFRGPVLRENYVPILRTSFAKDAAHDLRFVNLGGRGVRDLAAVKDGFLVLAGPVGEGPGSFQIYFWDGNDCLVGANPLGKCLLLAELPAHEKGKPEGLTVTSEEEKGYEIVVLMDGVKNGNMTRYHLSRTK
ncbi:MAG: DUF3616 domain-containing protein [Bryobacteraceae bacterium]|nr:DUF3616 domain-containing protein [Bryobacteraceae bacterium]